MNEYLSVRDVSKRFGGHQALDRVSLDIPKGQFTCLLGPSGCGKTTLLRIIAGLEQADAGSLWLGGKDITTLPSSKRSMGIVFQSYALFPNLTAAQNIAFGLQGKRPRAEIKEKVREMLALIDLEAIGDRYPAQLSGGQQQRVALARAVALSPDVLLLDEPLSALDAKVRAKLRAELRLLQERIGVTTVMVTHDQEEALTLADRIVVMNHAKIMQEGSPQDIYETPNSPFVADFVGAINFIPAAQVAGFGGQPAWMAVRPEQIRVGGASGQGLAAQVERIEFRGPYYRVTLALLGDGRMPTGHSVNVDVPVRESRQLGLTKHQLLTLELPDDRLLAFESEPAGV